MTSWNYIIIVTIFEACAGLGVAWDRDHSPMELLTTTQDFLALIDDARFNIARAAYVPTYLST